MSWSVATVGKSPEAASEIARQFATSGPCEEPEEGIRQGAAKLLALAIEAQDPDKQVRISAYGSQSKDYATGKIRNSLNITVTPEG